MFDATEALVAKRPDFAVKVGIYSFSSHASTVLPIQTFNRAAVRDALARLPKPGGGTAIGEAMRTARPDLYRAGVFRKYLLVVTDGENTSGRSPDEVAREIFQKSEHGVQIYFVAFDVERRPVLLPEGRAGRRDRRGQRPRAAKGTRRDLSGSDPGRSLDTRRTRA